MLQWPSRWASIACAISMESNNWFVQISYVSIGHFWNCIVSHYYACQLDPWTRSFGNSIKWYRRFLSRQKETKRPKRFNKISDCAGAYRIIYLFLLSYSQGCCCRWFCFRVIGVYVQCARGTVCQSDSPKMMMRLVKWEYEKKYRNCVALSLPLSLFQFHFQFLLLRFYNHLCFVTVFIHSSKCVVLCFVLILILNFEHSNCDEAENRTKKQKQTQTQQ